MVSFAQTNQDIKTKSKTNKNTRSETTTTRPSTTSGSRGNPSCFGVCANAGCAFLTSGMIRGISAANRRVLDRKEDIKRVTSLAIMPQFGFSPGDPSFMLTPRLRGTAGIFSTDFRFFSNIESAANPDNRLNTFDWQILQLNLVNRLPINLRIGSGFMALKFPGESALYYNEHTLGLDLFFIRGGLVFASEARLATDYNELTPDRWEASLTANWRFIHKRHFETLLTFGGLFQQYAGEINLWGLQTGLRFHIH